MTDQRRMIDESPAAEEFKRGQRGKLDALPFDIAANIVKDKLNAALAQPEQTALQDATDAQRYRRIRNGPYSDRHGDVYAMTFQGNGDVPIKREELDRIVDAALAIAQPKDKP